MEVLSPVRGGPWLVFVASAPSLPADMPLNAILISYPCSGSPSNERPLLGLLWSTDNDVKPQRHQCGGTIGEAGVRDGPDFAGGLTPRVELLPSH